MACQGIDNVSFITLGNFEWLPNFAHSWTVTAVSQDSSALVGRVSCPLKYSAVQSSLSVNPAVLATFKGKWDVISASKGAPRASEFLGHHELPMPVYKTDKHLGTPWFLL